MLCHLLHHLLHNYRFLMKNQFQFKIKIPNQVKDKVNIHIIIYNFDIFCIFNFNFLYIIVVGSPIKTQQVKVASEIKRIRVAPPKPGHLYPNLSEIENTTETDTEYTVNSTEAETATLDEKTDTETGTEAEYYVHVRMTDNKT